MLQDLVVAAVNDALRALARARRVEDGARDRRPRACRGCRPEPRGRPSLIEPVARLIEAFSRLPGIGPKTAQRLTYHLLRAPGRRGPHAGRRAHRRPRRGRLLRALLQHQRRAAVPDLPRPGPRPAPAVRRRGAARRPRPRADRRVPGLYHVLHGAISPIDGIGPDRLTDPRAARPGRRGAARPASRSRRSSSPPTRRSRARRPRCTSPSGSTGSVGIVTRIARGHPGRRRPRVRRRGDPRSGRSRAAGPIDGRP